MCEIATKPLVLTSIRYKKLKHNIIQLILIFTILSLSSNREKLRAQELYTLTDSLLVIDTISINEHLPLLDSLIHNDSLMMVDSLDTVNDSIDTPNRSSNGLGIESEVKYTAKDSIIMTSDGSKKVFLYGDAEVNYQDVKLTAAYIELDLDSNLTYARGVESDTTDAIVGLPVFTDKSGEYEMRTIKYNFKSEKAIIEHVVTEQGEGYVVSDVAKKAPDNTFCLKNGHYSTCNHHDHPHFYLNLTKAKVIPGKKTITGPAYLVIEDVPLYFIGIPFGFVPTTSSYSSGVIFPSYGEESTRGIFLRDGGYYWAANEYFDVALTGDIYANNSWAGRMATKYKKRYKYGGSFNLQYIENITSEKDLEDYAKSKDFSITWSHRQDSKANPYQTFSASVNYSSSSYEQNNVTSVINASAVATNTKRSSVSYTRRFPNSPFNLSANLLASQNSRDSSVSFTAPDITLTMNRIFPFKQKNKVGNKESWYEKISFSYTGSFKNSIDTYEYDLKDMKFPQDWENGVQHNIPISMNLKFLKYFTVTPNVSYKERWYFRQIYQDYDYEEEEIVNTDTVPGFNRVWDYSFGASTSTKVYAFFTPWRKLFGDKVDAIRHVMTPSASLSFRPDFGDEKYGYYDYFEYFDGDTIVHKDYSLYNGSLYGTPGTGRSGSLSLSLGNTLEMKVKSDRDSTGYKKIKLLEGLNFSTSHNFLADSLKWSRINMSGRTKVFGTNINFGAVFDPYASDTSSTGSVISRINESQLKKRGQLVQLVSANLSFGFSIGSDKIQKWRAQRQGQTDPNEMTDQPEDAEVDALNRVDRIGDEFANSRGETQTEFDEDGYANFEIPWNLSLSYSFRLVRGSFDKTTMLYKHTVTSDVNLSGDFSLTPKWKFSFSSGYNFDTKSVSHTNLRVSRDLHCWGMSFNVVPVGRYKSYYFSIRVNSSMLQDLKYEKRNSARDNPNYY